MSFPRYQTYKPSGVEWLGEVPEHWEIRKLGYACKFESGKAHEPFIADDGSFVCVNSRFISTRGEKAKRCSVNLSPAYAQDILMVMSDLPNGRALAKAFFVDTDNRYAVNQRVCRIQAINEHPRFLYYLLDRNPGLLWFDDGANQTHIPNSGFTKLSVLIPPFPEQVEIASFLDHETAKIDALIAEQQRLIELLQEKRQAVISQAVTKGLNPEVPMKDSGVEWLGEVPEHWEVMGLTKAIGPVVDYRGRTPTKCVSGTLLVTAKNIRNGEIDHTLSEEYVDPVEAEELLQRGRPKQGDVLFTMEAPLGQVALVDREDIALAQRVVKFRGTRDRMTNNFLMWWLIGSHCQFQLNSLSTGSTALGIKASKLSAVICVVPPVSEQQAIDAHVRDCNTRFSKVHALDQIELLKERRSALISAAVTGQIDVRGLVPEASAA